VRDNSQLKIDNYSYIYQNQNNMKSIRLSLFKLCLPTLLLFSCVNEEVSQNTSENIQENRFEKESIADDSIKEESAEISRPVLVIHGGAGWMMRKNFSQKQIENYTNALKTALNTGYNILESGGTSGEAVVRAIQILEEDSLFNAGVGAVLTHEKKVSLDASFMDGATGQAGAVSGISTVKSPIELAYTIMNKSDHVMLSGEGAARFAKINNLELVNPSYFITQSKLDDINRILKENPVQHAFYNSAIKGNKMGTVGAVALDKYGNLAAGTSTGGMANKKYGRIGDSPIIGAGTYADNASCAVSATGHGEFFIRNVIAYDIAARMKYKNVSLEKSAKATIDNLTSNEGLGGVIALDKNGNIAMPFNTKGMFRAYAKPNGEVVIELFD
jgi:beta-aspartyl-peptidase (threonine type)